MTRQNWIRSLKIFFLAVPVLVISAIAWYLQRPLGLEVSKKNVPQEAQSSGQPDVATKIHLEQFDGQRTQWTLDAPRAHQEDEALIVVEVPRLSIFRKDGEQVNVTARRGTIDRDTRMMNFHGGVKAEGDRQFGLLVTDWLRFNPKKGILYTDRRFYMENRGSQLNGVGLTLFQETKKIYVPKSVEMKFIGGVPTLTGELDS